MTSKFGNMISASALRGFYRQPLLSLIMIIVVAMLLLSCQADAQQNIKRNNMEKENLKEIYLAGGCFWGTEHYFKQIDGVVDTEVGYANGTTERSYL
jgi:peptide methionine sulfoxide reductase msrA/msrB